MPWGNSLLMTTKQDKLSLDWHQVFCFSEQQLLWSAWERTCATGKRLHSSSTEQDRAPRKRGYKENWNSCLLQCKLFKHCLRLENLSKQARNRWAHIWGRGHFYKAVFCSVILRCHMGLLQAAQDRGNSRKKTLKPIFAALVNSLLEKLSHQHALL